MTDGICRDVMRANYEPIMLINGIIASTSPDRYSHMQIDPFLLKLEQINAVSPAVPPLLLDITG